MPAASTRGLFYLRRCATLNVVLFLAGVLLLLLATLHREHGHFSYVLDDPYIHLALASRIRHGLYGLNAGEPSSPSSSLLWPLLLVPFAGTRLFAWMPLVYNTAFGTVTAWLVGNLVDRYYRRSPEPWRAGTLSVLLLLGTNAFGLVFTGLEHSLQVLCCTVAAYLVLRLIEGRGTPPWWMLVPVALLPSIRYEGLAITFAVAVTLWAYRARRTAAVLLGTSVLPPVLFSLFLRHLGLPWFPLSVLLKSRDKFVYHGSAPARLVHFVHDTFHSTVIEPERGPQFVLTLVLVFFAWHYRHRRSVWVSLAGCALVSAAQVLFGPVGWFARYEIYCLMFTLLLVLALDARGLPGDAQSAEDVSRGRVAPAAVSGAWLVMVGVLALLYARPQLGIPRTSLGIYEQQAQMGRFASQFDTASVAVNDLGWVSFDRSPQQYVLDLYGLGSFESFPKPQDQKDAAWLQNITARHNVGLVMVYHGWFPKVPTQWTTLGDLCALDVDPGIGAGGACVTFYATPLADVPHVRDELRRFEAGLPAGSTIRWKAAADTATPSL